MIHDQLLTRRNASEFLLKAIKIYGNVYEGEGPKGRSSYLMSMVLSAMGRANDAREAKALAALIRQKILGIPKGESDNLESYDQLVGYMDR